MILDEEYTCRHVDGQPLKVCHVYNRNLVKVNLVGTNRHFVASQSGLGEPMLSLKHVATDDITLTKLKRKIE